jgi:hypothetical protein
MSLTNCRPLYNPFFVILVIIRPPVFLAPQIFSGPFRVMRPKFRPHGNTGSNMRTLNSTSNSFQNFRLYHRKNSAAGKKDYATHGNLVYGKNSKLKAKTFRRI